MLELIISSHILATLVLLAQVQIEAHRLDGQKSAMIYKSDWRDGTFGLRIHAVQKHLTRMLNAAFAVAYLGLVLLLYARAPTSPWLLAAYLPGATAVWTGALVWGEYWFQHGVDRGSENPFPNPDELGSWYDPESGRWRPKHWFYGDRRRYQRPICAVLIALGLLAIAVGRVWI